ncbi:putative cyclic nucleotide-gated ion channel 17 [Platanthera guangdongensis]|uniref:Cyclic nucleotide-gated ion channel 17 n=1 Tax=Platanthera guangdongensis TaxID=2320717 RepID=A0ABR2MWV0_9ASPA
MGGLDLGWIARIRVDLTVGGCSVVNPRVWKGRDKQGRSGLVGIWAGFAQGGGCSLWERWWLLDRGRRGDLEGGRWLDRAGEVVEGVWLLAGRGLRAGGGLLEGREGWLRDYWRGKLKAGGGTRPWERDKQGRSGLVGIWAGFAQGGGCSLWERWWLLDRGTRGDLEGGRWLDRAGEVAEGVWLLAGRGLRAGGGLLEGREGWLRDYWGEKLKAGGGTRLWERWSCCWSTTYLQSITIRVEEWRLRRRDTEQWMRHRQLPQELQVRVRRFVQYKWFVTQGVDEDSLLQALPADLRRDIQRHLCLDLVRRAASTLVRLSKLEATLAANTARFLTDLARLFGGPLPPLLPPSSLLGSADHLLMQLIADIHNGSRTATPLSLLPIPLLFSMHSLPPALSVPTLSVSSTPSELPLFDTAAISPLSSSPPPAPSADSLPPLSALAPPGPAMPLPPAASPPLPSAPAPPTPTNPFLPLHVGPPTSMWLLLTAPPATQKKTFLLPTILLMASPLLVDATAAATQYRALFWREVRIPDDSTTCMVHKLESKLVLKDGWSVTVKLWLCYELNDLREAFLLVKRHLEV